MNAATLYQSAVASLPEIVVITGAGILLILGQLVRKRREDVLLWASVAVVAIAALLTLMPAGEVRTAYAGMFVADSFSVFFKSIFYLTTLLTFLLSRRYADLEGIGSSEYYVLLLFTLSGNEIYDGKLAPENLLMVANKDLETISDERKLLIGALLDGYCGSPGLGN